MNEYTILYLAVIKLLLPVLVAFLYAFGGRSKKFIRRWLSSAVLPLYMAVMALLLKNGLWWVCLLSYPLDAAADSVGYGVKSFLQKQLKATWLIRAVVGFLYGFSMLPVAFVFHSWVLFIIGVIFSTVMTSYLGSKNPLEAPEEELVISYCSKVLVPWYF